MAERKQIASISIITDSETPYDNIGDVDGGFDAHQLENHIRNHGHQGLCEKLTIMQWQVWAAVRQVNSEKEAASNNCVAGN